MKLINKIKKQLEEAGYHVEKDSCDETYWLLIKKYPHDTKFFELDFEENEIINISLMEEIPPESPPDTECIY